MSLKLAAVGTSVAANFLAHCNCILFALYHNQDLYQRCEKMRPTLFRLASDTEDNDEALGESCSTSPDFTNASEFVFNVACFTRVFNCISFRLCALLVVFVFFLPL